MGLFGFLRKENDAPLQTFEVRMSELPAWFKGVMRAELKDKIQQSEQLHKEIVAAFSGIRSSLDRLDEARLAGNERLHIAANMIKESFAKKKYASLNSLAPLYAEYRPDYRYFLEFQEKSMEAIKELKTSTPKQTIMLSRYFKKESQELVDNIKKAEEALGRLGEFLKAGSGALGLLNRITNTVEECSRLQSKSSVIDKRVSELKIEIEHSKERRQEMEKRFLKLLKSREWGKINSLGREAISIRKSLREAEMKLNADLAKVRKPMKDIEHMLGRKGKLTPMQKNTLRDFIRDPLKTVMSENGLKSTQKCMKAVKRLIDKSNGGIDVDAITERLDNDVPQSVSAYRGLESKLKSTEKRLEELSRLADSKTRMENEIKRMSEDISRLESELRNLMSERAKIREQVKETLRNLEVLILEESQKKVRIVI